MEVFLLGIRFRHEYCNVGLNMVILMRLLIVRADFEAFELF